MLISALYLFPLFGSGPRPFGAIDVHSAKPTGNSAHSLLNVVDADAQLILVNHPSKKSSNDDAALRAGVFSSTGEAEDTDAVTNISTYTQIVKAQPDITPDLFSRLLLRIPSVPDVPPVFAMMPTHLPNPASTSKLKDVSTRNHVSVLDLTVDDNFPVT